MTLSRLRHQSLISEMPYEHLRKIVFSSDEDLFFSMRRQVDFLVLLRRLWIAAYANSRTPGGCQEGKEQKFSRHPKNLLR